MADAMIKISVRNLVEFVLRSGDIDKTKAGKDSIAAMQAGAKLHKKIQGHMGASYHPEVPLKFVYPFDDYELVIDGRADGIIYDGNTPSIIDEIKGVYMSLDDLDEPIDVHIAQAMCYAYIVANQYELPFIKVQMTYANLDSGEIKRFIEEYSYEEIEGWFNDLILSYKRWSDFLYYWKISRNDSLCKLKFPFNFREGQQELCAQVYKFIDAKEELFIQAPTGVGKTIATLFPALKCLPEGKGEKIFYLTAKTITKTVAKNTLNLLQENGAIVKGLEITARDKICPLESRECNPNICMMAKGHYDRINDALYDILTNEDLFNRDIILEYAEKHCVCPYELSLDLSMFCDVVICDYNYVFDPTVSINRPDFCPMSENILLVDEAHNLVDRAREMYSETLIKEEFLSFKKILAVYDTNFRKYFDKCNKLMLDLKKQCERLSYPPDIDLLILAVFNLSDKIERFLEIKKEFREKDEVLEFYFKLLNFLSVANHLDEKYSIYCDYGSGGEFRLHLYCVDPSRRLSEYFAVVRATILFSATLLPINYYKSLITTNPDIKALYAHSIFDTKKRLLFIANDVTSKYTMRSESMYEKYARYVDMVIHSRTGNYMVFAPSYVFMEHVYDSYMQILDEMGPKIAKPDVIVQKSDMDELSREEFLDEFRQNRSDGLVAFCVLGGIFSEGIDLVNEQLVGALIIGTGLGQLSIEGEVLSSHFDAEGRDGFDYAYRYPGMNKVLQAAGRVIRTVDDCGIIGLLDERFTFSNTKSLFPREWADYKVTNMENLEKMLSDFWDIW